MKQVIITLLVVVLCVLLFIWLWDWNDTNTNAIDENNDQEVENDSTAATGIFDASGSWNGSLAGPVTTSWYMTLRYPNELSTNEPQAGIYTLKYVGPNSEPATEITDGFLITIQSFSDTSARAYVDGQDTISEPTARTFLGRDAWHYQDRSKLSNEPIDHIAFTLEDDSINDTTIDISYMTSGARSEDYVTVINQIFDTMSFTLDVEENAGTMNVELAMLDYDGVGEESDGPTRGCDRVVFVERSIDETVTPLNASLELLFSMNQERVEGWHNFISQTKDTLAFDRAELTDDGTAHVYLTGELSGLGGVCDNPRAKIQIEETALQFDTVTDVQLYLNGEETELQPGGRGE